MELVKKEHASSANKIATWLALGWSRKEYQIWNFFHLYLYNRSTYVCIFD